MTHLVRAIGLILCVSIATQAQGLQIEVVGHGGIPLNDTLQPEQSSGGAGLFVHRQTDRAAYMTGVSAGVVIRDRLHLAFGAMYMPVSFTTRVSGSTGHTHGTS